MAEAKMIELYHMGYMVCLVCAILFFLLSIAAFFFFRIPQIWDMKTGRGARRAIQRMAEVNAQTGQLLNIPERDQTPIRLSRTGEMRKNTGKLKRPPVIQPPAPAVEHETTQLPQWQQPGTEMDYAETGLLKPSMQNTASNTEVVTKDGRTLNFEITKSIMWIHTQEKI